MEHAKEIAAVIRSVAAKHLRRGTRGSENTVVPNLRAALAAAGFDASQKYRIPGPLSLGRVPETAEPSKELAWAEADVAIYRDGRLVGIVESEHSLAWVRRNGERMPGSSGAPGYTMSSIALDSSGEPFASYAPLERMAFIANWRGDAMRTADYLRTIRSDDLLAHNPLQLPFFLISEVADSRSAIIVPRMEALGVTYIECA